MDTMERKTAIVLGGIVPHISLLEKLKERGYYTVLIDYYQNPPAKHAADLHLPESTLDLDAVKRIAEEYDASLICGFCVDQAMVVSCCVSEQLGLPVPFSYESSINVTNKARMKQIMWENGVPTSRFFITKDPADPRINDLTFPIVVKPVDNNGSKGVTKVDAPEDVREPLENALSLSRAGDAVVEEFNEGYEIQIDCFIKDGQTNVLMTRRRLKTKRSKGDALQSFGSMIPAGLSDELQAKVEKIASDIAKAFELNNTPFFIQAIVNGDDIKVLEFAPRIGGSLSYSLIKRITGFDILDAAVDSLLGEDFDIEYHKPEKKYTTNIMYAYEGIFGEITGVDDLVEQGVIDYFFATKTKGMDLGSRMDSRNRVACYIISGETDEELIEKARAANEHLDVLDTDGKSIMRKDLCLDAEMLGGEDR